MGSCSTCIISISAVETVEEGDTQSELHVTRQIDGLYQSHVSKDFKDDVGDGSAWEEITCYKLGDDVQPQGRVRNSRNNADGDEEEDSDEDRKEQPPDGQLQRPERHERHRCAEHRYEDSHVVPRSRR